LILRKIVKIVATRCHILRLKCTGFNFVWGSAVTTLPHTPSWIYGVLLLRGGGGGQEGREWKGKGGGRGGKRRRGEGKGKMEGGWSPLSEILNRAYATASRRPIYDN